MDTYEEIYKEYFTRVYSFLLKLCGDVQLAEELTQETFFQAFLSFRRFKGESGIFTWLISIAKHVFYKYLKKNKLNFQAVSIDLLADVICTDQTENPEEILQKKAVTKAIRKLINEIPEKYRDVVILRIYAEMPFSQVALTLGISEDSAKVIYFRAKKMLEEELKNDYNL